MTTRSRVAEATDHRLPILAAAVALAALLVYVGAIHPSFLADDWGHVGEWAWSRRDGLYLRPVVDLSFWIDRTIYGLESARGFHVTNMALHALNGVLVYLLVVELGRGGRGRERERDLHLVAGLGGFLYVTLSGHANAVSWVVGRGDVIATFFVLGSFWCYLRYRSGGRPALLLLSLGSYQVAVFSKESVLTWPLALLAYEVVLLVLIPRPGSLAERARSLLAPLAFLVPLAIHVAVREVLAIRNSAELSGFDVRRLAPRSFQHLLRSLFPAEALTRVPSSVLGNDALQLAALGLLGAALVLWYLRGDRTDPVPARALALSAVFIALLVPPSQKKVDLLTTDLGSRLNYLPSAFVVIVVALVVGRLWSRSAALRVCAAVVMLSLVAMNTVALVRLNRDWRAAGDVTESILGDLARLSGDDGSTLLVVGLPDRIDDAYVFRNGFRSATNHLGIDNALLVAVNDNMVLPTEHRLNRVAVEPDGDTLLFTTEFRRWYRVSDHGRVFETDSVTPSSFRLSARAGTRIVVYSQGAFRDVRPSGTPDRKP
jgi:hypothetical protein